MLLPLLEAGAAHIRVINRSSLKAHALVEHIALLQPNYAARLDAGDLDTTNGVWDIIINATSSSLDQKNPLNQPSTFMKECVTYGATQCADGLGMLVGQAAQSFFIWHGLQPDTEPVLHDLRQRL